LRYCCRCQCYSGLTQGWESLWHWPRGRLWRSLQGKGWVGGGARTAALVIDHMRWDPHSRQAHVGAAVATVPEGEAPALPVSLALLVGLALGSGVPLWLGASLELSLGLGL
jgi:hypothetical protein